MSDNRKYYYLKLKESYFDEGVRTFSWTKTPDFIHHPGIRDRLEVDPDL